MHLAERGRVLVVDDDFNIRETVNEVLVDAGYAVTEAGNGAEAMQALRQGLAPCVILLDLMMPVMDGWEFRTAQLQEAALANIPVIVLTADGSSRRKAASIVGVESLEKPVRLEQLLSAVSRHCKPSNQA